MAALVQHTLAAMLLEMYDVQGIKHGIRKLPCLHEMVFWIIIISGYGRREVSGGGVAEANRRYEPHGCSA